MEKIELLEELLEISKEYEFLQLENGDHILKIRGYYESDKEININFWELIHLLKHYTGVDSVLLTKEEIEEE